MTTPETAPETTETKKAKAAATRPQDGTASPPPATPSARDFGGGQKAPAAAAAPKPPSLSFRFRSILAELERGNPASIQPGLPPQANGLSPRAACLLCAHMIFEKGEEDVELMTAKEVRDYADAFTSRFPSAWGALGRQDILKFIRVLNAGAKQTDTVLNYQTMSEALGRP